MEWKVERMFGRIFVGVEERGEGRIRNKGEDGEGGKTKKGGNNVVVKAPDASLDVFNIGKPTMRKGHRLYWQVIISEQNNIVTVLYAYTTYIYY